MSVVNGDSAWLSPTAILKKFGAKKGRLVQNYDFVNFDLVNDSVL